MVIVLSRVTADILLHPAIVGILVFLDTVLSRVIQVSVVTHLSRDIQE